MSKNNNSKLLVGVLTGAACVMGGAFFVVNGANTTTQTTVSASEAMFEQMVSSGYKQDYDTWLSAVETNSIDYRLVDLNIEYGTNDEWVRLYSLENLVLADAWYDEFVSGEMNIDFDQYYSVSFNTGLSSELSTLVILEGETIQTPNSLNNAGQNFIGWDYDFSNPIMSKTTVNAIWENRVYTITFDTQGGDRLDRQDVTFNDNYTLPTPVKYGFVFEGWKFDDNHFNEGNWTYTQNVTLVAQWSTTNYQISFDSNGGTSVFDLYVDYMSTYTLPTPIKSGYRFAGWYYNDDIVYDGEYHYENDIQLVAKWVSADTNFLTFDTQGGSTHAPLEIKMNYDYTLPTPTKTGYTFVGWYCNGELLDDSKVWQYDGDSVAVARWNIVTYYISYTMNSGTNNSSNPTSYTVEENMTLIAPTRNYCTFVGWTINGVHYDEYTFGDHTERLTIVANWEYIYIDLFYYIDGVQVETVDTNYFNELLFKSPGFIPSSITTTTSFVDQWYFDPEYTIEAQYINSTYTNTLNRDEIEEFGISFYAKTVNFAEGSIVSHYNHIGLAKEYVVFGKYPNTVVTNENTIAELNKLTTLNSDGYYEYNGEEYTKVSTLNYTDSFSFSVSSYSFYNNGIYVTTGEAYFKVEPIRWQLLTNSETGEVLCWSDMIVEEMYYSYQTDEGTNDWNGSNVRAELNSTFFNTAFTDLEKGKISTREYIPHYGGDSSIDKVFIIDYETALDANWGFVTTVNESDLAKFATTSDFNRAQGSYTEKTYETYAYWTGRTYSSNNYKFTNIVSSGDADMSSAWGLTSCKGVRPVIKLSSLN